MIGAAFGLACLGFLLLGFSLKRNFRQVWPESTDYSQWIACNRILGCMLIFLALVPSIVAFDVWIGLAVWAALLALAAVLQILLLTYWPSRALQFSGASVMLVIVGFAASAPAWSPL